MQYGSWWEETDSVVDFFSLVLKFAREIFNKKKRKRKEICTRDFHQKNKIAREIFIDQKNCARDFYQKKKFAREMETRGRKEGRKTSNGVVAAASSPYRGAPTTCPCVLSQRHKMTSAPAN